MDLVNNKIGRMQIQRTSVQQQHGIGSPYPVHPVIPYTVQQAFQAQNSPLSSAKRQHFLEMTSQMTPPSRHRPLVQETSFTVIDPEEQIQKINAMFPTVSEYHIRMLMKKYYNREAVVISKLQVEKYPQVHVLTPQLSMKNPSGHYQMTPPLGITSSPVPRPGSSLTYTSGISYSPGNTRFGYQSPKPHSSPKMKLRYMKSLYPKADETLILDILAGSDNNVQMTSEKLKILGYEKRDPRLSLRRKKELEEEQRTKDETITVVRVIPKTSEEKLKLKAKLQSLYKDIPEKVILMAMDCVDEEIAIQILNIVKNDNDSKNTSGKSKVEADEMDNKSSPGLSMKSRSTASVVSKHFQHAESNSYSGNNKNANQKTKEEEEEEATDESTDIKSMEGGISNKHEKLSRPKIKNDHSKVDQQQDVSNVTEKTTKLKPRFQSIIQRANAVGPNRQLNKGQNDDLLLVDYITWNGANPSNLIGSTAGRRFAGSDPTLIKRERVPVRGPNPNLCNGRNVNVPKGSIYARLNQHITTNIICN